MDAIFGQIDLWLEENQVSNESAAIGTSQKSAEDAATAALGFLEAVQAELLDKDRTEIVAISLQDMQKVNKLLRVVVFYGICPYLEPNLVVYHTSWTVPELGPSSALANNVKALYSILKVPSDLSDVVRMTEFLPFVVAGAVQADARSQSTLFEQISQLVGTFDLYKIYVRMLSNKAGPAWLQNKLAQSLSLLPYTRPDALRAMIELFTGFREHETIKIEHIESLVDIFVNPPRGKELRDHIQVMDAQLFGILSQVTAPADIISAACYLTDLLDSRFPQALMYLRNDLLVPLTSDKSPQLDSALMALTNLCDRNRAQGLVQNVASQTLPMLWLIFVHLCQAHAPNGSILKLLAHLCADSKRLATVVENALVVDIKGLTPIVLGEPFTKVELVHTITKRSLDFEQLEVRVAYLMTVLNKLEDAQITSFFVELLREALVGSSDASMTLVLKLKLLERMGQDFKAQLFSNPTEIVDLALSVLNLAQNSKGHSEAQKLEVPSSPQDSDDEDEEEEEHLPEFEMIGLCIDLLNSIILECFADGAVIQKIRVHQPAITKLSTSSDEAISSKASYTCKLLESVSDDGVDFGDDKVDYNDSTQVLETAKSSLVDPLPPVKAHGLQLVRKLVQRQDPVLDMATALQMARSSINEEDSYIYLNAVKTIEQCAQSFGTNQVLPVVVEWYNDPKQRLDVTLRMGEVLGRIIQSSTSAFKLETTALVLAAFLAKIRVQNRQDDRLRVSAMSLMGLVIAGNAHAAYNHREQILDCCLGVLRMEQDAPMQRSALVALLEYIGHINSGTIAADPKTMDSVRTQVEVCTRSNDEVVSSYAKDVLAMM